MAVLGDEKITEEEVDSKDLDRVSLSESYIYKKVSSAIIQF